MSIVNEKKSFPDDLRRAMRGYSCRRIRLGMSSSKVFRLEAKNRANLYLKISPRLAGFSLLQEKSRLEWLAGRLPVPEVLLFVESEKTDYLLLSEIPGLPASDDSLKNDPEDVIYQLTKGLRTIHRLPLADCPFQNGLDYKIELARERMLAGLVDEDDFDDERRGRTAEEVFREMNAAKPSSEDRVFTHGDFCAPNVILADRKLSGFIDWAAGGIADKYQDIALLTRSVRYNFGARYEKLVFEIYGIEPDPERIRFYRLLDEFF